jgi:hypothetical protein
MYSFKTPQKQRRTTLHISSFTSASNPPRSSPASKSKLSPSATLGFAAALLEAEAATTPGLVARIDAGIDEPRLRETVEAVPGADPWAFAALFVIVVVVFLIKDTGLGLVTGKHIISRQKGAWWGQRKKRTVEYTVPVIKLGFDRLLVSVHVVNGDRRHAVDGVSQTPGLVVWHPTIWLVCFLC